MPKSWGRAVRAVGVESSRIHRIASVRKFLPNDADALVAIAKEAPQAATWSRESYVKFAGEEGSLALVLEICGEIRGFLVGRCIEDQAELLNLAVGVELRREGHGTALLAALLNEVASKGAKSVYLEVRQSNTGALAFYEKHGFAKTGRRKGYYREPDEAAVTMEKKLTGPTG
jgi:[ribosomal protein S18]-alanine N-acetyltransferase